MTEPGLGYFFAEAAKRPLLTAAQEVALAKLIEDGDPVARRKMVEHNIRLAIKIAKNHRDQGLAFEDLVQEGMIGLHRAADKYDWRKGFRFSTYATHWIRHYIQRAVHNTGSTIRTPGHIITRRMRLLRHLDQHPDASIDQLAIVAECRDDQVEEALDTSRVVTSLDAAVGDDRSTHDIITDPDSITTDDIIEHDSRLRGALDSLPEFERNVIEMRWGFNGSVRSRDDVANALGVQPHVVQRAQRIGLAELRRLLGDTIIPSPRASLTPSDRRGDSSFTRPGSRGDKAACTIPEREPPA